MRLVHKFVLQTLSIKNKYDKLDSRSSYFQHAYTICPVIFGYWFISSSLLLFLCRPNGYNQFVLVYTYRDIFSILI